MQGHPEAWGDTNGPPEEDHDQCAADEGADPQQECAICARITPTARFALLETEAYLKSKMDSMMI